MLQRVRVEVPGQVREPGPSARNRTGQRNDTGVDRASLRPGDELPCQIDKAVCVFVCKDFDAGRDKRALVNKRKS